LALGLESVPSDVHGIWQVGPHETDKSQIVQSCQGFRQALVITGQTAKAGGPSTA
jgi:hypothetical protein